MTTPPPEALYSLYHFVNENFKNCILKRPIFSALVPACTEVQPLPTAHQTFENVRSVCQNVPLIRLVSLPVFRALFCYEGSGQLINFNTWYSRRQDTAFVKQFSRVLHAVKNKLTIRTYHSLLQRPIWFLSVVCFINQSLNQYSFRTEETV